MKKEIDIGIYSLIFVFFIFHKDSNIVDSLLIKNKNMLLGTTKKMK